ncbi:MAG: hypothetical protein HFE94_01255 [Acutalibacter sp.]|nr:hypothetical protein [Acutalibacter sp.]
MTPINIIAVIFVLSILLYLVGYVVHFIYGIIKEEIIDKIGVSSDSFDTLGKVAVTESGNDEANVLNDLNFQRQLNYLRPYWRVMTLAGGTDPWLFPQIRFENDRLITLTKKGYDLWPCNLIKYYGASGQEERETALHRFATDLFGEYAEEVKRVVSIENIADYMIELKEKSPYSADFTLVYTDTVDSDLEKEQNLLVRELQNTKIFIE